MVATSGQSWCAQLGLVSYLAMGGVIANFGDCALAQITPDGTLPNNSIVTPQENTSVISGGTQAGGNLFHSFEEFSIPTGGEAFFNNALNIQNIFSRVTGGSVSNIDGLIRANGTTNLFLLNPNGIIFGPNASLNIGGSFVASTASSLNFADGTQFSATAHSTAPLLTVSVPIGLQYGGTAGSILNQSQATDSSGELVGLQVQPGKTLALVGGDVSLDGGNLQARGGRVELGGLAGAGTVGLNVDGKLLSLSFPDRVARADVSLVNRSVLDVSAGNSGSVGINARNLDILQRSVVLAGIESGLGFSDSQAGDITLNVTEEIRIGQRSFIADDVLPNATGNSGNIRIITGSLSLSDSSGLEASTYGQGNAGSITISARNSVSLDGTNGNFASAIFSRVEEGATGQGGNIRISTGSLSLTNGGQISASTFGEGSSGSVIIEARDVVLNGVSSDGRFSSAVFSTVGDPGRGQAGNIQITTRSLSVTNGAKFDTTTFGQGNAGNIIIDARDTVFFNGADAFSVVQEDAIGRGGDIRITTGSLAVTKGGQLQTLIRGQGKAGNIIIDARDTVAFDGVTSNGEFASAALSTVEEKDAIGKGGEIRITTGLLSVTNGAQLGVSTWGQGDAGSIILDARDRVWFNGITSDGRFASGALSAVQPGASGKGGSINITTPEYLSLTNGAGLSSSSLGEGTAGDVEVTAGSIRLDQGSISSQAASGDGGNITLSVQERGILTLRRGSNISTTAGTAQAGGDGGNISINSPFIVVVPSENSDISANAFTGRGGRVDVAAQGIFGIQFRPRLTSLSDITASSEFGVDGVVEINTPDVDPSQGLATLPAELVDASRLIASSCADVRENRFIVTGRGGLPPNPSAPLSSDTVWSDLRYRPQLALTRSSSQQATKPTTPAPTQIVEAQGWMIDDKGSVVLTASAPAVTPDIPWLTQAYCHALKTSS